MKKASAIMTLTGILLALFTIACRYSYPLADWYALQLYPRLSASLSWVASFTTASLQDIALVLLLVLQVGIVVQGIRRKWSVWRCLGQTGKLLLWTYVWFYLGWCTNYSRSSIYMRLQTEPAAYQEAQFMTFIGDFVRQINEAWTEQTVQDYDEAEAEMKAFYAGVPALYGLATPRSWQHPKTTFLNGVYSSVGVLGFMEPLFSESCLNQDLLPVERPAVHAHEYAHLLGVSSEAEANWWAFQACSHSKNPAVRYSGYLEILPHVMRNARMFLPVEDYRQWVSTLRPEVIADLKASGEHWQQLQSPRLRQMHEVTYDAFLKGNNIQTGRRNYSEVVGMLMSLGAM